MFGSSARRFGLRAIRIALTLRGPKGLMIRAAGSAPPRQRRHSVEYLAISSSTSIEGADVIMQHTDSPDAGHVAAESLKKGDKLFSFGIGHS